MATCDDIELELSAYSDGALPASERAAVESHLAGCASCKSALIQIEKVRSTLQALPKLKAPARMRLKVREQIAETQAPRPNVVKLVQPERTRWIWPMGVAAAVLISMLGYVTFFQPHLNEHASDFGVAQNLPKEDKTVTEMQRNAAPAKPAADRGSIDEISRAKDKNVTDEAAAAASPFAAKPAARVAAPDAPFAKKSAAPNYSPALQSDKSGGTGVAAGTMPVPADDARPEEPTFGKGKKRAPIGGDSAEKGGEERAAGDAAKRSEMLRAPPPPPATPPAIQPALSDAKPSEKAKSFYTAPALAPARKAIDPNSAVPLENEQEQPKAAAAAAPAPTPAPTFSKGISQKELRKSPEKPGNAADALNASEAKDQPAPSAAFADAKADRSLRARSADQTEKQQMSAEERERRLRELATTLGRPKPDRAVRLHTRDLPALIEKIRRLATAENVTLEELPADRKSTIAHVTLYVVKVDSSRASEFVNLLSAFEPTNGTLSQKPALEKQKPTEGLDGHATRITPIAPVKESIGIEVEIVDEK